jgi:DNA-binding MarR family transcriptional regulator
MPPKTRKEPGRSPSLPAAPDLAHETIGLLLSRTYQNVHRNLKVTLRNFGLTLAEWRVLRALNRKNGLACKETANLIGRTLTEVTGARVRLEHQGLIRTEPHARDGRSTLLFVTPAGRRIFREVRRTVHFPFATRLGPEEFETLVAILRKITQ